MTFALNKALSWTNTNLDWLLFKRKLHVLFYEDLLDNLPEEMRRIIEFLDLDIDEQSFECMLRQRDGIYKRRKRNLTFDPFTKTLRKRIDFCKKIVDKAVKEFLAGNNMESYVNTLNLTTLTTASKENKEHKSEIRLAR